MYKKFPVLMTLMAIVLMVTFVLLPTVSASASIADGSYEINYEMKEASSDSTSIADGYFTKPATLTVENGAQYIQLTVTSAEMVKSIGVPSGPVTVVSDNGDTRTVKFKVDGDLSKPLNMSMHVVVPEEALPGGYDMTHTTRAIFDVSDLPAASTGEETTESSTANDETGNNAETGASKTEENPPTGDSTQIALLALLLVGSGMALFTVRKFSSARN